MADKPSLFVEFFQDAVENRKKSEAEGRPIFEDREMVRLKFPGDKNRVLVAPAQEAYRRDPSTNQWITYAQDFPDHYKAFKEHREYVGDGTPISELTFLTEARRAELRSFNVHTAEQLAAMDGTPLQRLGMGARALKEQAQAFLDRSKGSALETRMAAENAALREQLDALQAQMTQLSGPPSGSASDSPFENWQDEDIKVWIADHSNGARPKGNPSHATLVSAADELNARLAEEAEAA